jgi:polygalacturonase
VVCLFFGLMGSCLHSAPTITTQPTSVSTPNGTNVTFSVTAAGTGNLTYQWRFNGVTIPGATGSTYTVTNPTPVSAGAYSVVISDLTGSCTSLLAVLTTQPVIPTTVFDITSYGAVPGTNSDGTPIDNASAINAAISAANAAGGGVVRVPAAAQPFIAGRLFLLSNVKLQVDAGATIEPLPYGTFPLGSDGRYDDWFTASGAHDVEIGGTGTIDGNGQAWWDAFHANSSMPHRPYLIKFTNCTTWYVHDVTLHNSPMFHLVPGACTNVTIDHATITASGTNPANTDAIDPSGSNILIENSTLSVGDDNVAVKPQSTFCRNIVITHCTMGTGHGISVGGQSNTGLDGMLVSHCTMTGTDNGFRLKADATQGGPVQNITYTDVQMTNVTYPIVFYSYYRDIGNPGNTATTGTISPSKYNTNPPDSLSSTTIPTWKNITIDGLTVVGASGGSIIWGLPQAKPIDSFISVVRLNNVSLNGGVGSFSNLRLYNVYDVQCSGTNAIGTFTTYNALAISSEPKDTTLGLGGTTTLNVTTAGTSGVTPVSSPSYQWYREGVKLTDGTQANGTVVAGATTASLGLSSVQFTSAGHYWVTVSNSLDAYNTNLNTLEGRTASVFTTSIPASLVVTQGYSAWATAAGLSGADTNMSADPDGDHIVNLGEYALGLSPTIPNTTGLPTLTRTNSGYVFRYTKPNWVSGVTYNVLISTDFLNWTVASPIVESLTTTSQTFVVPLPQGPPTGFARLVLTFP